jgi:hypothetical protein
MTPGESSIAAVGDYRFGQFLSGRFLVAQVLASK